MNDSDARITTIKPFFNRPCSTSTCGNLAKAGEKRCLDCIVTRARFKSTKSPIPTPALTIARPERAEVPALIQWKISPVSLPMPAPVESSWVPVDSQRYRQPIVLPATPAVEFIHIDPTPLGTGRWKPWEPVPVVKPSSPKRKRENTEGEERVTKLHKHDSKLPNHDSVSTLLSVTLLSLIRIIRTQNPKQRTKSNPPRRNLPRLRRQTRLTYVSRLSSHQLNPPIFTDPTDPIPIRKPPLHNPLIQIQKRDLPFQRYILRNRRSQRRTRGKSQTGG